jgi:Fe-S cluster assembly scaffold protein SufB
VGPKVCPETSITKQKLKLRNIPEERRSQFKRYIQRELEGYPVRIGLTVSATKTKVMPQSRTDLSRQQIQIRDVEGAVERKFSVPRDQLNKIK